MHQLVDQYLDISRKHQDSGLHLLAKLGLEQLKKDKLIRKATHLITITEGINPCGAYEKEVEGVDLVEFFRYVREKKVNFFKTNVGEVVLAMKRS